MQGLKLLLRNNPLDQGFNLPMKFLVLDWTHPIMWTVCEGCSKKKFNLILDIV